MEVGAAALKIFCVEVLSLVTRATETSTRLVRGLRVDVVVGAAAPKTGVE